MDLPDTKPATVSETEWQRLRLNYETAFLNYADAAAVIGRHLTDTSVPTRAEFQVEQDAANALTEARRAFWSAWRSS
jgi:hypothetical protein